MLLLFVVLLLILPSIVFVLCRWWSVGLPSRLAKFHRKRADTKQRLLE